MVSAECWGIVIRALSCAQPNHWRPTGSRDSVRVRGRSCRCRTHRAVVGQDKAAQNRPGVQQTDVKRGSAAYNSLDNGTRRLRGEGLTPALAGNVGLATQVHAVPRGQLTGRPLAAWWAAAWWVAAWAAAWVVPPAASCRARRARKAAARQRSSRD